MPVPRGVLSDKDWNSRCGRSVITRSGCSLKPPTLHSSNRQMNNNSMNNVIDDKIIKVINDNFVNDSDDDEFRYEADRIRRKNNFGVFTNDSNKEKTMARLAELRKDGFASKNLPRFIENGGQDAKLYFSPDGDITISNIKLLIPDLASHHKQWYEKELDKIKAINCQEREILSRWIRISTIVSAILLVILTVFILIYIIYRAFFSRPAI